MPNKQITNPVWSEQSDKWHDTCQDWHATWDPCPCKDRLERLASCISAVFASMAYGGRKRFKLLDRLKREYGAELDMLRNIGCPHE